MVEKLFKRLNRRTLYIFSTINKILIIGTVASLVLLFAFGFAGRFIRTGSLCGICIVIFLIGTFLLVLEGAILTVLFLIDTVKRDGILKLLKGFAITYILLVVAAVSIRYALGRGLDWDALVDCIIPVWGWFFSRESYRLIKGVETGEEYKDKL